MDLVRDLISLGRNVREEVKIKVRQPISEVILDGKNEAVISDLTDLIKEELNVKNVTFAPDLTEYMTLSIKPNFRECGKMFGKEIGSYAALLESLSQDEINMLENNNEIVKEFNGSSLTITPNMVDIRVSSKEGYDAANMNNNFIVIDTKLTEDLIMEGIARELVSKVQNLRKEKDFNVADRINIYYYGDIDLVIDKFNEYIKNETLSVSIEKKDNLDIEYDLNGKLVKLDVEKVNK